MELLIHPYKTPSGRLSAERTFEMDTDNARELIDYAINRSNFYYVAGKKVYTVNVRVQVAIVNGQFKII